MLDEPSIAADRGGSDVVALDQTGACASLCLSRYRVTLTAIEPLDLPAYLGSTLRGGFGHVFRGPAMSFLPYFSVALRELRGIGRGRHPVALRRVEAIEPLSGRESLVYSDEDSLTPPGPVKVRFLTYTRLKHEGQWAIRPRGGLRGPISEPLRPFRVFGQWTHVGRNATFSLGRYELVSTTKEKP
jgi:hypothetical protein